MLLSHLLSHRSTLSVAQSDSKIASFGVAVFNDGILLGLVGFLPFGLATGLVFKRLLIQCENLSMARTTTGRSFFPTLAYSIVSGVVADLLLEISLQGWCRCYPRFVGRELPNCFLGETCIHLVFLLVGVWFGERFVPITLTGSIATGKSTVSKLLVGGYAKQSETQNESDSFLVIDTDAIAHEILLPPQEILRVGVCCVPRDSVFERILTRFGDPSVNNKNILSDNGTIDRRKLGDVIFKDRSRRKALNGITHPKIIEVLMRKLLVGLYRGPRKVVVADIPLLYESKSLVKLFALKIVVACNPENQLRRLRERNPDLSEAQCRERIASQIPVERKAAMADVVINNDEGLDNLKIEVEMTRRRITALLHGKSVLPLSAFVAMVGFLWICLSA